MWQPSVNMIMNYVQSEKLFLAVKIVACGLKIIGLAPFTVPIEASAQTRPRNSSPKAFQSSKLGLSYNILLLLPVLLIAAALRFHWPNWFPENHLYESLVPHLLLGIFTAERIIVILVACVVVIFWGCKQKDAVSIMNRLLEADNRLSVFKKQSFNKRGLLMLIVHAVANTSLWITFWVWRISFFDLDILLPTFLAKMPDYIVYWFIIEYFITVAFLAQYIRTVNKYLLNFNEFGNYLFRPRVRDAPPFIPVVNVPIEHSSQLSSLKLLHSVRTTLFDLCGDVADFFSFPILLGIICCVTPLVSELYVGIVFATNANFTTVATASYAFFIIFFYMYPIMTLASNITRTGKEAKLTGQIVHKLLAAAIGQEIKTELAHFSLQLLHEDVKFTAYELFTLDSRILLSVLGALATYSLGLIQIAFDCDCESSNSTSTATR